MTTWSIKVVDHPEVYLVVADTKRSAVSYLETYLAEKLNIREVSEMDDGTIIALDALDDATTVEDEEDDEENWREGIPPPLYGEVEDDEDEDEEDEDDEDEDDDWDEDDEDEEDEDDDWDEDDEDEEEYEEDE